MLLLSWSKILEDVVKLRRNTRTKKFIAIRCGTVEHHVTVRFIFNASPEDIGIFFFYFCKAIGIGNVLFAEIEIFVNCIVEFLIKRYWNNCTSFFFSECLKLREIQVQLDFSNQRIVFRKLEIKNRWELWIYFPVKDYTLFY